jgi:hypothetical protein
MFNFLPHVEKTAGVSDFIGQKRAMFGSMPQQSVSGGDKMGIKFYPA